MFLWSIYAFLFIQHKHSHLINVCVFFSTRDYPIKYVSFIFVLLRNYDSLSFWLLNGLANLRSSRPTFVWSAKQTIMLMLERTFEPGRYDCNLCKRSGSSKSGCGDDWWSKWQWCSVTRKVCYQPNWDAAMQQTQILSLSATFTSRGLRCVYPRTTA